MRFQLVPSQVDVNLLHLQKLYNLNQAHKLFDVNKSSTKRSELSLKFEKISFNPYTQSTLSLSITYSSKNIDAKQHKNVYGERNYPPQRHLSLSN